ncbi:Calcipressin-domain-containing protein [Ascodesmis nigricans]|uniref:Calcipressin-domain-containing protein n=1 Tax=Ascodesmis nigricans TaxID=341454 RepID=A0A4V3SJU8_9PEZI|nr:Calcipressin-domain-containing protein [Ascodesmis nigricans]
MDSPSLSPLSSPGLSPARSRSRASSRGSHLTLDLSNLPPLTQPAEPSNTLLITNLTNPEIFTPANLDQLQSIISSHAPLASWSPLKSFRRIVCSFTSTEDAIAVRQALDGESLFGVDRVRVYFGQHTPLQPADQHLQAPAAQKQFFISPPPSPPLGWESRHEDPPNSVMLAEDLAHALAKLNYNIKEHQEELIAGGEVTEEGLVTRPRSNSSVLLFEPESTQETGMPQISLDDYTDSADERSPVTPGGHKLLMNVHTQRPPVELMEHH